jgi:hypothetical protein
MPHVDPQTAVTLTTNVPQGPCSNDICNPTVTLPVPPV